MSAEALRSPGCPKSPTMMGSGYAPRAQRLWPTCFSSLLARWLSTTSLAAHLKRGESCSVIAPPPQAQTAGCKVTTGRTT